MTTPELLRDEDNLAAPVFFIGVFESVRRHKLLTIIPIILLTAVGVAYGLRHKPVYTATTQMWVSNFNLNSAGALSGYSTAASSLASTYARLVDSQQVARAVGRRVHMAPGAAEADLSATPVPASPLFNVTAQTHSSASAILLANSASNALVRFVGNSLNQFGAANSIYHRLHAAVVSFNAALVAREHAQARQAHDPTPSNESAVSAANTSYQLALARMQSLQSTYESVQSSAVMPSGTASILTPATSASSDRISVLEKAVFVALVAGIALGLGLALARANMVARRWLVAR